MLPPLRIQIHIQRHLANDIDRQPRRNLLHLEQLFLVGLLPQHLPKHHRGINNVRHQRHEMPHREAGVEHGADGPPRRALQPDHVLEAEELAHVDCFERGFGEAGGDGDLVGDVRIGDHEELVAKGPEVDVEEFLQLVLARYVVGVDVGVGVGGEVGDAVASYEEVAEKRVVGGSGLEGIGGIWISVLQTTTSRYLRSLGGEKGGSRTADMKSS